MDGKIKTGQWGDFTNNRAHEVSALFDYTLGNGYQLNLRAKFMDAPQANYVDFGGSSIFKATAADNLFKDGSDTPYNRTR